MELVMISQQLATFSKMLNNICAIILYQDEKLKVQIGHNINTIREYHVDDTCGAWLKKWDRIVICSFEKTNLKLGIKIIPKNRQGGTTNINGKKTLNQGKGHTI